MRLRTSRVSPIKNGKPGILRAIVSPSFTPIEDSHLASILMACLRGIESEPKISRLSATDRTVSYVIAIGKPFGANVSDRTVGDVAGGLIVRNSGVGFASLVVGLQLTRLICMNGMTCPVEDPLALRQAHRSFDEMKLVSKLAGGFSSLSAKLGDGVRRLVEARNVSIVDPVAEFYRVLRMSRASVRLVGQLEAAYALEPEPTAFGIVQAATRASQNLSPEERFELDRAAGLYLTVIRT